MSRWAHLPEDIFGEILPYLDLKDLVALSTVSKWCYLCVKEILKRTSYARRFRVEKTDSKLGDVHGRIQNFMRWALPAWPCVLFYIHIRENSAVFVHYSLSEYETQNLWVSTSSHGNLYGREIVQCPANYGLTLCNIFGEFDLRMLSPRLRVLEISHSTLTFLRCPRGRLTEVCLSYCRDDCIPPELAVDTLRVKRCYGLRNIENLGGVRVLSLHDCLSVNDVSALSNVHTLDLTGCTSVTDVSALGRVHSLNLLGCHRVTDVSALSRVHTLDLSRCTSVTNVHMLNRVHTLYLSWCHQVTDVSGLSCVHTLNLSNCNQLVDVSGLGHVHNLDLSGCTSVTNVSMLGSVHTLNLAWCISVTDVSELGRVHMLTLSGCTRQVGVGVGMLSRVHTLNLSFCQQLTDVSALSNVHTLNLSSCHQLSDVSSLGSVHTLDLSSCHQLDDVSALGGVYNLNLSHTSVTNVKALGNVHTLNLSGCKQVRDVSTLHNVHTLDLRLTSVTDVSALRNVRCLCIMCTGVTDVCVLSLGVKVLISKCMATHRICHPGVIYRHGQNICVNDGYTHDDDDRYLLCIICSPRNDYDGYSLDDAVV